MIKLNRLTVILLLMLVFYVNSFSQFGKNKVQYETFDWKYIQTVNFDIYYNKGSKYLADFTARVCEKSLISIQTTLNHKLSSRVIVVVYGTHNEFQQTNVVMEFMPEGVGGVTELFKNRVVVPFQGDWAQLDHVIHHELGHAVLNDMYYGGTFQSAMMNSGGFALPLWMNEGFVEWESIGGMNPQTDMFMRDLTLNEKLPPLNQLDGYLAYRGGQTFYHYVAEKYGKERVGDLINRLRIYRNLDLAFESAFQMSFEDFSERWVKDIKKFYFPDMELFADPKDYATALTDHEKDMTFYNTSPAISPDGEKMAYISTKGGVFGIFVRKIDDKKSVKQIVSSSRAQDFEDLNMLTPGISWNQDGTKLAISAKAGGEDAVFIVDADDGDYERMKFGLKSITSVQWSQDGSEIAFIGTKNNQTDIFIYNFKSKELKQVTDDVFSVLALNWSADGKRIFFISDRGNNLNGNFNEKSFKIWKYDVYQNDIYEINIADKSIERLTFDPENHKTSLTSVHGDDRLMYVSDKNGIGNLYIMDLGTKKSQPLTNSLYGITQVAVSRDASKALFTVQINGGYDIYMMKYPLESKLAIDELPLTKFRQNQNEQKKIIQSISDDKEEKKEDIKLTGYGDYEISYESQQMVNPNIDVQKDIVNNSSNPTENNDSVNTDNDDYYEEKDYKIKFSPDLIYGNPGYNTFFGAQGSAQMLFSDILGDHQIYIAANLLLDLKNSQLYVAYNYLPKIIDYSFNIYHSAGYVPIFNNIDSTYPIFRFRNLGAGVNASYPFSLFNRLEFGIDFKLLSKENMEVIDLDNSYKYLAVPRLKYVYDNTLWGYYGPRDGLRYYVEVFGSPKFGSDGLGFTTFQADFRKYIPLGWYFGLAFRGAGGASFGPDPLKYFMGGTDNWLNRNLKDGLYPFKDPQDFAFPTFGMPLRGWAISEVVGNKYFLANAEFRFPLITALLAGPLPILIQGINGAVFFDAGSAWNDDITISKFDENNHRVPGNLLMSSGFGIRAYLLGIPLKIDIAWRNEIERWSEPYYLFSLGLDF